MKNKLLSILTFVLVFINCSFGQINTVINESFTNWPAPGWKIYQFGDLDTWHHGISTTLNFERFARHNPIKPGGYQNNWLVSPPIQVTTSNYTLIFDAWQGSGGSDGRVLISNASGVPDASGGTFVPIYTSFPTATFWTSEITVDLSPFVVVGQTIYIAFQVKSPVTPAFNTMLLIDDVIVGPPTSINGTISMVTPIDYNQNEGDQSVKVNIKNSGTQPIGSYTIDWTIDGVPQFQYNSTSTDTVKAGSSKDIEIGTYIFSSGIHTIDATVNITGDVNTVDNTVNSTYSVGVSNDILIGDIWPKGSGKNIGSQPIIVNVYNHGSDTLKYFEIEWGINDSARTSYTENVVRIFPGEAKNITVGSYNFSSPIKRYKIDARLILPSNLSSSASEKTVFYSPESVFEDFNSSVPPNEWTSDTSGFGVMLLDHSSPWDGNNISNWYYYGGGNDSTNSKSIVWSPKLTIASGDIIKVKGFSPSLIGKGTGRVVYRTGPGQQIKVASVLTWDPNPLKGRGWYTFTFPLPAGAIGTMQIGLQSLEDDKDYICSWDDFYTTAHYAYPILPGNLNMSSITDSSAIANWSASPSATSYTVRYRILGTTTWTGPISTSFLFASLTGLKSSNFYEVQATAVNANGSSENCTSVIFLVPGPKPAPPILGLVQQSSCQKSLTASITLNGLPSGSWTLTMKPNNTTTTGTGMTTTISGLHVGKYTFTVSNSAGTSASSPEVTILPFDVNSITAPNQGGPGTQPQCGVLFGSIVLSGLPKTGTWTIRGSSGLANVTSVGSGPRDTLSGLGPGKYKFTVSQGLCTSDSSATMTLNNPPAFPVPPVLGSIVQPSCNSGGGSVSLSGLSPVSGWKITRHPDNVIAQSSGLTTTITGIPPSPINPITGLQIPYYYTLTNSGCESGPSNSFIIDSVLGSPQKPSVGPITSTCGVVSQTITFSGLPSTGTWTIKPGPQGHPDSTITGTGSSKTIPGYNSGPKNFTVKDPVSGCWSPPTIVTLTGAPSVPSKPTIDPTQPTCQVPGGKIVVGGLPALGTWTLNAGAGAISGTGQNVAITGLAPGKYTYKVTKFDGCTSVLSDTATINAIPTAPATPSVGLITQPTATVSTGSVVLSGLPAGNWVINPGSIVGTGSTTTLTGVFPGPHTYTVTSGFCTSNPTTNVIINDVTPAAPLIRTIIQPTCTSIVGSVILEGLPASGSWTITPGPMGPPVVGSGTTLRLDFLLPNTYSFRVTNSIGQSIPSNSFTINGQPSFPSAPIVGTIGKGSVELSGLPSGNWSINPGTFTGSTSSTTLSNLPSGTYGFTVTNAGGCVSPASTVVIAPYVGISEISGDGKTKLILYPNPADEYLNFSININEEMIHQVRIFDIAGKMIYSEDYRKTKQNQIVLDDIPNGFYFFEIITPEGRHAEKFTVINK